METKSKRGNGRVYKHGNWWWIDIQFKTKRVRKSIIRVTAEKAEKIARAALAKEQVSIAEGKYLDMKKETKMTFRELADKYMTEWAMKKKKSWKQTDSCCLVHLNKAFGSKLIDDIYQEDVLAYQTKRLDEGVGPYTINHEISLLRGIYYMAMFTWRNPENRREPLFSGINPGVMRKKSALKKLPEVRRERYMTIDELKKFLEVATPELRDYALVALTTGMRKGELKGLNKGKVNFDEGVIKLKAVDTKTSEARSVPMCQIASRIIARRYCDFSSDIMRTGKTYPFGKALRAAKIEDFHWHDFRHTFSTYMEECGVSSERRGEIMGHSNRTMTGTYTHISVDSLLKDVRKLDAYLAKNVPSGEFSVNIAHNRHNGEAPKHEVTSIN